MIKKTLPVALLVLSSCVAAPPGDDDAMLVTADEAPAAAPAATTPVVCVRDPGFGLCCNDIDCGNDYVCMAGKCETDGGIGTCSYHPRPSGALCGDPDPDGGSDHGHCDGDGTCIP